MMHGPEKSDPVIVAGADEQSGAIRSGVGGAKNGDQGECGPAKHALDSEPGARVTGAETHTAGGCRHTPEVGAACGKAARADLCGGREATRVPTAKAPFIHHGPWKHGGVADGGARPTANGPGLARGLS